MNPMLKLLASNKAKGLFTVEAKADTNEATIYLYDMIVDSDMEAEWWGGVSPQAFIKTLNAITAPTIHLRVNSPGGSVFAARAIEQAIREHKSTVVAHVDGLAASAASFLILAADQIEMAPGSFLMIHKSWTMAMGNADDMRKTTGLLEQIDGSLASTYAAHTGQDVATIAQWMADETWIDAENAVKLKFADRVASDTSTKAQTPGDALAWDTSVFKNAPRRNVQDAPAAAAAPTSPGPASSQTAPEADAQPDREALRRAVLKALIPS